MALLSLAPRAPLLQPVVIASRWRASFHPSGGPCFTLACLTQRRQAAVLHALLRLPRRLRVHEAFGVCQLAGAFGERYPRGYSQSSHCFTRGRMRCWLNNTHPRMPGFHPRAGWVNPNRRHPPEDSQAPSAEDLSPPPQPPRWPVAGRKPKPAPESVVSPQKGASRSLNKPLHSRALCRSEPRKR
jgi:hypothetical protein